MDGNMEFKVILSDYFNSFLIALRERVFFFFFFLFLRFRGRDFFDFTPRLNELLHHRSR